jgi:hypothetical protein
MFHARQKVFFYFNIDSSEKTFPSTFSLAAVALHVATQQGKKKLQQYYC